ncbi:MAG TPA: hypothetical protein VHA56_00400 [Mucilaginibacter sp.]|nr:hypothetical protein [Mucilaginibacter sp.]
MALYRKSIRRLLDEHKVSTKLLKETRLVLEKEHGREFSDKEVEEVALLIKQLGNIALEQVLDKADWDEKLKDFPKGYEFTEKGYTCRLCGGVGRPDKLWYDKYGIKCMPCQRAVETKVVPGTIVENKDSYYSEFELNYYFKLKGKMLREWMKKGLLHGRMITGENGKSKHYLVFLMKDNKGFLPPKKMLMGGHEVEMIDGKEWTVSRPWYHYVDPFVYLKKYRIMQYMQRVDPGRAQDKVLVEEKPGSGILYCNTCSYNMNFDATRTDTSPVKKRKAARRPLR